MVTIAKLLGVTSGFALMGSGAPPATLLATSLAIDLALAPLTAVIASRRGRNVTLWTVAGLAFGMWALAAVLVMRAAPSRTSGRPEPPRYPPTSDAA
ncbi:MAG TPA: hypothetical protein VEC38_14765 [Candidatus Binataceae bacterium]|nr:hypothetical protein [Candidatus Binataceae bacterium]